jgi:hypothetical protein
MGFLYGTAFAVFTRFRIPLGKLPTSDAPTLIPVSLASGARHGDLGSRAQLHRAPGAHRRRWIGEAGRDARGLLAAHRLLPSAPRDGARDLLGQRIYLGAGLGLTIGGQIVGRWDAAFPDATAPFGLRGWQVAFFVVGLPGLLLALWVRTLREPVRGAMDALPVPTEPHPFRVLGRELAAVLPPATLWSLWRSGAGARSRRESRRARCSRSAPPR